MESANLQLPDQLVGSPAPNLAAPSNCFGFGTNIPSWSSSTTTTFSYDASISDSNPNYDGIVSNSSTRQKSTDHHHHHQNILVSDHHHHHHHTSNLVQDLQGFPWSCTHQSAYYNDQIAKIKEEMSEISFPKFTEMLNSPVDSTVDDYGSSLFTTHLVKNQHNNNDSIFRDLSCSNSSSNSTTSTTHDHQNPLVKTNLSSSCQINAPEFDHSNGTIYNSNKGHDHSTSTTTFGGLAAVGCRGQFSHIYPSVNISSLTAQYSNLMGMNLKPGLNHISASASFYNNIGSSTFDQPLSNLEVDSIQQQCSHGHSKTISSFNSEIITEAKRPSSLMEPKTSTQSKKPRSLESRTPSCPPFKVRKEKLGDRIAALQQLVSPFGKTDTASVLMEAIGYIKFLQNQVETLSVPYMKSSHKKSCKTMQGSLKDHQEENEDQARRDLKSRGLCLVPLSCVSYVTGDTGGGSIWPPVPNFGGRIT